MHKHISVALHKHNVKSTHLTEKEHGSIFIAVRAGQ